MTSFQSAVLGALTAIWITLNCILIAILRLPRGK